MFDFHLHTKVSFDGKGTGEEMVTAAAKADILASAGGTGSGGTTTIINSAAYEGPFAVTASGSTITVAGGRMYLAGTEYTVGSTTLTSSNGNIYYYLYYTINNDSVTIEVRDKFRKNRVYIPQETIPV